MTRKRLGIALLVALAVALGLLFGGVLNEPDGAGPTPSPPAAVAADHALSGFSLGDTESLVAKLQAELRASPDNPSNLGLLGLAYQQRARETGDPTYYEKSGEALEKALALAPDDLTALGGLGSLALARHEFATALQFGERARAVSPTTARTYGVIGDALLELGRYDEAFQAFDTMVRLKPSLAAYSRISYARELLGDRGGAIDAMELALDAARGSREPTAWTLVQLGKLHWSAGELDLASSAYGEALDVFPGYVYALDALAQVEGARGNLARAIGLEKQAVDRTPLPQFVTQLGDLYHAAGLETLSRDQYDLMDAIDALLSANGVKTDLETAVYYADHGIRPADSVELARLAQRERPSIAGDDGLAWALERDGRCKEALGHSQRALRLGTQDASLFFHRGMIERCLGNEVAADRWFTEALDLNPHFSLRWAPVARREIA